MALHLVRHGVAVERRSWPDDDALRPLADEGTRQADALAGSMALDGDARVLSSPARRCIDTVAPTARRAGVAVESVELLAEGEGMAALGLLRIEVSAKAGRAVVACTHGDVLAALLNAFVQEDGLKLPAEVRWAEASTWTISFDDNNRATSARYHPVN